VQVVVALGKIGFDAWLQLLRRRGTTITPRPQFGHGVVVTFPPTANPQPLTVLGCYHPSRQNTNTGKLTPLMMRQVFAQARKLLA
jgi:uracil-DNA glycosylase